MPVGHSFILFAFYLTNEGHSHVFESEGAQSPIAISGPSCLKKWEGQNILLLLLGLRSGGGTQEPPGPLGDYDPAGTSSNS